jgi:hypothetical protein
VDILEGLAPYLGPETLDSEIVGRLHEATALVERKTTPRS